MIDEELGFGHVVVQVHLLFADQRRIQRGLTDVDVTVIHQLGHLSKEEREQQAWRKSASEGFADRWWTRGRTGSPGTFSAVPVAGQKRYRRRDSEGRNSRRT